MYDIKLGSGCGIKATLLTPSGRVCDLRKARYIGASLVLPSGQTMVCEDLSVNEITNSVYVRLLAARELTSVGQYGIVFNVKLSDRTMYATPVVHFAEVVEDGVTDYRELTLSLSVSVVYFPDNVAYTGASPKISSRYTWLVYNDSRQAYEDTGIPVRIVDSGEAADDSEEYFILQARLKKGNIRFDSSHASADGTAIAFKNLERNGLSVEVMNATDILHLTSDNYRLVFMRESAKACKWAKGKKESTTSGSRMRAPMLSTADASSDKRGRPISTTFQRIVSEDIRHGNIVKVADAAAFLNNYMPLRLSQDGNDFLGSFRGYSSRRTGRRFGVAIYKRCNSFGQKWKRISNIAWWKIHLGNCTRLWGTTSEGDIIYYDIMIHTPI